MAAKPHIRAEKPRPSPSTPPAPAATAIDITGLTLATMIAFWPVLANQFVNWDDPDVIVGNVRLGAPGVLGWAFSTTLIGHYQPLAWMAWSATTSLFGLSPGAFHALSLAAHVANGALVYILTRRLCDASGPSGRGARVAAIAASFVFALHPLRVEAVAWASAAPYVFSLTLLLVCVIAYVDGRRVLSIACYGLALLARASAIGLPVVLLLIDFFPLERHRRRSIGQLVAGKIPYAVLALAAAAAETWAREAASLADVPLGARVTMTVTAPFYYLARTFLPVRLTPLDALPISPSINWTALVAGSGALVAVTAAVWVFRRRWPGLAVGWLAFLALLAPVAGLTPSGVQATADRYMYVPGVALSIVVGAAVARAYAADRGWTVWTVPALGLVLFGALGAATWRQTRYWNDSVSLWTRVIELDSKNDIATYNLAIALAERGREDEAVGWYERSLALVPDHDVARRNLELLQAARAERDGNRLAQAGRLDEASDQYARALALDGRRLHSRAARGVVLMRLERFREAATELRLAIAAGSKDAEVANALAFSLVQTGDEAGAAAVLRTALADHPDDVNLQRNLAGLEAGRRRPPR
jgi:Flp pilus assembly protein TadD